MSRVNIKTGIVVVIKFLVWVKFLLSYLNVAAVVTLKIKFWKGFREENNYIFLQFNLPLFICSTSAFHLLLHLGY